MIILVVPVAALLLALVWVNLERRPAREAGPVEQVEAHRRVLEALAAPSPLPREHSDT